MWPENILIQRFKKKVQIFAFKNYTSQTLISSVFIVQVDKKLNWCWQTRGTHLEVIKLIKHDTIRYVRYGLLLLCYSNFVPTRRFSDIRLQKMSWSWNPGHRSLKVIRTDTCRSATYDFLLTLHSNHEPTSYRFRDKWRFQSKIANSPPPCI